MKICMVGLGSIGKKHVENLIKISKERNMEYQIDALRSNHTFLREGWMSLICHQYDDVESLPDDYDIAFITNPTSLHFDMIRKMLNKTKHMFIEKPVFDSLQYNVNALSLKKDGIYYVACPLRHKSILKYVKNTIIEKERIISVRALSSSYLPSWRKGVDYRTVYSADKNLGGGVTRDLIHEWDYIRYLFGDPDRVFHIQDHVSDLEINSEDLSVYIAKYPGMILEIHLDYIGHKTERILQMFTSNKRIDVDLLTNILCVYKNNKLVNKLEFAEEDFYLNEIRYFMDCIEKGKENINTVVDAYNTLKIALSGE